MFFIKLRITRYFCIIHGSTLDFSNSVLFNIERVHYFNIHCIKHFVCSYMYPRQYQWTLPILWFKYNKPYYLQLLLFKLHDLIKWQHNRHSFLMQRHDSKINLSSMGYSRQNTHPPDGWQAFLTPPSDWISQTARAPLPPGFPSSRTPLPPGFPLLF